MEQEEEKSKSTMQVGEGVDFNKFFKDIYEGTDKITWLD